jgi:hypothetical protein
LEAVVDGIKSIAHALGPTYKGNEDVVAEMLVEGELVGSWQVCSWLCLLACKKAAVTFLTFASSNLCSQAGEVSFNLGKHRSASLKEALPHNIVGRPVKKA